MSQWGEIEDINLVRDKETQKSQGTYCMIHWNPSFYCLLLVLKCFDVFDLLKGLRSLNMKINEAQY